MGFLPEAINNYLLRLGWSHGDEEIISQEQAIEWFDLDAVGKSASRFDMDKLSSLNSHYINEADNNRLVELILPEVSKMLDGNVAVEAESRLKLGMDSLKDRAKNIQELSENAVFYATNRPVKITLKAAKHLDQNSLDILAKVRAELAEIDAWNHETVNQITRDLAENEDVGLGKIAQPLRSALSGSHASPGIFEVMEILGKEESLARLDDVLQ
jgi:glutamyl-tRNA synthetase